MHCNLQPINANDRREIVDIFNYYVENSFAAYPEEKVPYEFFDFLMRAGQGYPSATARTESGEVVGFGLLRPYSPIPTLSQAAEITYFLKPGFTGQGIGKTILDDLQQKAKERGITTILASVSSLNEESLAFHRKNGFTECGRFTEIGLKKGKAFDVVYFQKKL